MARTVEEKRAYHRRYMRERRARERAEREALRLAEAEADPIPEPPADPVAALSEWAAETLVVPPGHPAVGEPMALPPFAVDYLSDAVQAPESLLCVARKNAKSSICAVLALGYLAGPLRVAGWRGAIASLSKHKANELRMQVEAIAVASGLGVQIRRHPYPGTVSSASGVLETLAADKSAGHASGYDLVIVDELGLFPERSRDLMAGLRSSVSAKGGRLICISVRGDSPLLQEMLDRAGPACPVHIYAAPEECDLDDREAWRAANPTLGTIKQTSYMEAESARVAVTPADQPNFRAFDLNQRLDPSRKMLLMPDQWRACEREQPPERAGPVFVGYDLGGSTSMTAAAAYWPETGRLEGWCAFPSVPDLRKRGTADGIGTLYRQMYERGELLTVGEGEVVNVAEFLKIVAEALRGERIGGVGADRYRRMEALTVLREAGLQWRMTWRGTGAHAKADGSHDVRAFQRAALSGGLFVLPSLAWRYAMAGAALDVDRRGNPALYKAASRHRIDLASAAVIAVGLASVAPKKAALRWASAG